MYFLDEWKLIKLLFMVKIVIKFCSSQSIQGNSLNFIKAFFEKKEV